MGILSDFLGGSEPEAEITSQSTLTPEQQEALKKLLAQLTGDQGIGGDVPAFGGDLNIGQSGTTQNLLAELIGGTGRTGATDDIISQFLTGDPTDVESLFKESIQEPLIRTFQDEILPSIDRRFASSGFFGSERGKSVERSTEDLLQTLVGEKSKAVFGAEEAAKGRALQALSPSLNFSSGVTRQIGDIGSQETGLEERNVARNFEEFARQQAQRTQQIQQLLAAIGTQGTENIATVTPGKEGAINSILGALPQAAVAAAPLLL